MICLHKKDFICDYPLEDIVCTTCLHYPHGVKETGATPNLGFVFENPKAMFAITILGALASLAGCFFNAITHYTLGLVVAIIVYVAFMVAAAKFAWDIYMKSQKQ